VLWDGIGKQSKRVLDRWVD